MAAILACMSLTLTTLVLAATLSAKLPMAVRIYDAVGLSPHVLAQVQETAGVTLAAVGIQPVWRPCHVNGCVTRPKPHEIEIRIVNATPLSPGGSLGYAAIDVEQHAGVLGTVFADRVGALGAASGVNGIELLGHAVAHEIGHLVLGTPDHSRFGLMRATWTSAEIRRARPSDWTFSNDQGTQMRGRLSRSTSAE